mmetsp:Transcript_12864/g.40661  ORF Transcript_12864/g.40661 Transcript_12864/m.40661 type:complete len:259 (+) Transcript_12864:941-1717(+)
MVEPRVVCNPENDYYDQAEKGRAHDERAADIKRLEHHLPRVKLYEEHRQVPCEIEARDEYRECGGDEEHHGVPQFPARNHLSQPDVLDASCKPRGSSGIDIRLGNLADLDFLRIVRAVGRHGRVFSLGHVWAVHHAVLGWLGAGAPPSTRPREDLLFQARLDDPHGELPYPEHVHHHRAQEQLGHREEPHPVLHRHVAVPIAPPAALLLAVAHHQEGDAEGGDVEGQPRDALDAHVAQQPHHGRGLAAKVLIVSADLE